MTLDRSRKVNISKCWTADPPSDAVAFVDLDQEQPQNGMTYERP